MYKCTDSKVRLVTLELAILLFKKIMERKKKSQETTNEVGNLKKDVCDDKVNSLPTVTEKKKADVVQQSSVKNNNLLSDKSIKEGKVESTEISIDRVSLNELSTETTKTSATEKSNETDKTTKTDTHTNADDANKAPSVDKVGLCVECSSKSLIDSNDKRDEGAKEVEETGEKAFVEGILAEATLLLIYYFKMWQKVF